MNEYLNEIKSYEMLNEIADKDGVVVFGSTFTKNIPVSELAQALCLKCSIFNRSFNDLSVFDAVELFEATVKPLEPKKVLLQLGETDLARGYKSIDEIVNAYENLITTMRIYNKRISIVVVSVCSNEADAMALNVRLEELARKCKCQYADVTPATKTEKPGIKAFSMLKFFIKDKVSFYDAMNFC